MAFIDDFEDVGGQYADMDYENETRADIAEDRNNRLNNLKGKYIITCDGKKKKLYLQDQRISKNN